MARTTSFNLGDHFEQFIAARVASGRYGNASEVVRDALRLMEKEEQKLAALRQALIEGEKSGKSTPLDMEAIRKKAKQTAGLTR
ncbi:MAG: type II toxin-antitoxin system ParD family antitoxin [Parahaliea sp.]